MEKELEEYLSIVEKSLKPMPTSERVDIIKEIKSSMIELEKIDGLSTQEIVDRLGNPKELAKEYLGNAICESSFQWNKILAIIAFYSITGLSGMIVIPFFSIISVALIICSFIVLFAGIIKTGAFLFGYEVSFVMFQIGSMTAHPLLALPIGIIAGILFFIGGKKLWKLMINYIHNISKQKKKLSE